MFFFRHPRPVVDGRTHAVQVVQQKTTHQVSRTVLIVDMPVADMPASVAPPVAPKADAA